MIDDGGVVQDVISSVVTVDIVIGSGVITIETIDVPIDADLLYIGISICGIVDSTKNQWNKKPLHVTKITNDIYRVYNMLSSHGILVCSALGAILITRCVTEAFYKNIIWDAYLARTQHLYNVYALNTPIVYQDKHYNSNDATEKATYIKMDSIVQTSHEYNVDTNVHQNFSILTSSKC